MLKAAHAVSRELVLDRLLGSVIGIALENAGAEGATLTLLQEGHARVVTRATVAGVQQLDEPLEQATALCRPAVVLALRTGEAVLVDDALADPACSADAHVQDALVRSVLVVPLIHQGRTTGALYLEHRAAAAFSPARVELLAVLASHAASALDNARMYRSLEQQVAQQTAELRASLERVVQTQRALDGELADAADYVRGLLPRALETESVRARCLFLPSADLGGDGLGFQALDERRLAFYLLDVCGHGIKSCLLSIAVLTTLHQRRLPGADFGDPASVLSALNAAFPAHQHGGLFFTLWYGVVDHRARTLRYCSAGHPGALLVEPAPGGASVRELDSSDPMLGVADDAVFTAREVALEPGARVLVLSDGVYEVSDARGQLLDFDRFVREVREVGLRDDAMELLLRFARSVRGEAQLEDDFSMLEVVLPG